MNQNGEVVCKEQLGDELLTRLGVRFTSLWRRCARPGTADEADTAWEDLRNRYGEPHRRYHDLCHVNFCLKQLDRAASMLDEHDAAEMSIWYHDVIYEPGGRDNETRSAGFFAWYAVDRFSDDFVANVRHLILATAHPDVVEQGDAWYITDIDLSSFALPWEDFQRDNAALREEQQDMSDADFDAGKRWFLTNLLERPRIYRTDFFYDLCEERARDNIRRWLAAPPCG